MERATIRVAGTVQSVGFRPFVYRTATDCALRGTVRNLGDAGVRIELEGHEGAIDEFLSRLQEDPPPLARIESVAVEREVIEDGNHDRFEILPSAETEDRGAGTIPPDTAICEACVADMRDATSRYHRYWATACVDCGPRFTVVEDLPYDRPTTSMAAFPMCADCRDEYEDPADRRYHAQAIACPQCGPTLNYGTTGTTLDSEPNREDDRTAGRDPVPEAVDVEAGGPRAVQAAAETVNAGEILVVKGVGGAHLVCDATDADAVDRLRDRTGRPAKPFALMAPTADAVEALARLSDRERTALTSPRRPIVLLRTRPDMAVANAVAPGLHTTGVMLPYAGVHHLLFDHLEGPLVCTSANLPGRPMLVENGAIVSGLTDVADAYLLHDRRIVARCDDSVVRVVDGDRRLLRRSRGFTPTPVGVSRSTGRTILAVGPELDVTPAILADGECYLSQYAGDLDDVATFQHFRSAVDHLRSITGVDRPAVVAHDAHPSFRTTAYARRLEDDRDMDRVAVQHHHAHAASVLGEHDRQAAVAITIDGVGYGADGTVWGGEVLDASRDSFERVGGLAPVPMPGGDRATRYPGRLLAGMLFAHPDHDAETVRAVLDGHAVPLPSDEERDVVVQQLKSGVNTPTTTSAGRYLDAVSALLGVCGERTYEGEPAMRLEALAIGGEPVDVDAPTRTIDGRPTLYTPVVVAELVERCGEGTPPADLAATAQEVLARALADQAVDAADRLNRDAIALSGGVAYNDHIATRIRNRVDSAGLTFLGNRSVPPGDGGIAYGQSVVAAARTG